MKCSEARFALAADPRSSDPALLDHLEQCPACAAYASDMHDLDARMRDVLAVPVPDLKLPSGPSPAVPATPAPGNRRARRGLTRRFALAAGIAGVAVLAGLLWTGFPRPSLASAVVAHMAEEPDAWSNTTTLSEAEVAEVLSRSGVRLAKDLPGITYAHSCRFRGRQVPHLIVQTPEGPVTVLVLPHERVERTVPFDEGGYRGTLVPAPLGSIAVLTRDEADIQRVAAKVVAAVAYSR